jgi:hypothetical protein
MKKNMRWRRAAERQCPNDPSVGDALEIGDRFARVKVWGRVMLYDKND